MQVVLLVRHAQAAAPPGRLAGRMSGIGLTEDGRFEAERLAERLRAVKLVAVYSSPLDRCRETARAIVAGRRIDVRIEPGVEEVDFGRWQGGKYQTLVKKPLWRTVQYVPSLATFPSGESIRDLQHRTVDAVERLRSNHRGTFAIVSHADVIKVIVAHYLGMHLDLYQRIVIPTASVTAIGFTNAFPRLLRVGDTGDYTELVPPRAGAPRRDRGGLQT